MQQRMLHDAHRHRLPQTAQEMGTCIDVDRTFPGTVGACMLLMWRKCMPNMSHQLCDLINHHCTSGSIKQIWPNKETSARIKHIRWDHTELADQQQADSLVYPAGVPASNLENGDGSVHSV